MLAADSATETPWQGNITMSYPFRVVVFPMSTVCEGVEALISAPAAWFPL